jgi:hypothetical protein
MNKLTSVLLAVLALTFVSGAAAGDRFEGHRGWYRHPGHGHAYGHHKYDHGYRSSFSIVLGMPLYWPPYHYSPYRWYSRPPVIVQQAPVTYVQREPAAEPSGYWYFCPETRSYYPYTQTCPSEWLQVVPQTVPR